jgi:hypothetical protein
VITLAARLGESPEQQLAGLSPQQPVLLLIACAYFSLTNSLISSDIKNTPCIKDFWFTLFFQVKVLVQLLKVLP